MIIILFIYVIFLTNSEIIDCKLQSITNENRVLECNIKDKKLIAKFDIKEWPKEWDDSSLVGDIVKLEVGKNEMIPIKSCSVRIKEATDNFLKTKVKEGPIPTNFYIPKDCQ